MVLRERDTISMNKIDRIFYFDKGNIIYKYLFIILRERNIIWKE